MNITSCLTNTQRFTHSAFDSTETPAQKNKKIRGPGLLQTRSSKILSFARQERGGRGGEKNNARLLLLQSETTASLNKWWNSLQLNWIYFSHFFWQKKYILSIIVCICVPNVEFYRGAIKMSGRKGRFILSKETSTCCFFPPSFFIIDLIWVTFKCFNNVNHYLKKTQNASLS